MQKKSLGKGLSALISGAASRWTPGLPAQPGTTPTIEEAAPKAEQEEGERIQNVAVTDVHPSPMQPRKTFRDEQLQELVESIREHGIIQPLVCRKVGDRLELIAGERRFRACQRLGLTEVPVILRQAADRDVLEMALIENLQREDLNPLEAAEAYCRLAKEFNMKQEDIAKRVGKNRATVANSMRLVDLPEDVKALLVQGRISPGHAKAILSLRNPEMQSLLADMVVRQGLTVRETERRASKESDDLPKTNRAKPGGKSASEKHLDAHLQRLQNKLRDKLSTHVQIFHQPKKGRIEIEYYGDEDLGRVLELLGVQVD